MSETENVKVFVSRKCGFQNLKESFCITRSQESSPEEVAAGLSAVAATAVVSGCSLASFAAAEVVLGTAVEAEVVKIIGELVALEHYRLPTVQLDYSVLSGSA